MREPETSPVPEPPLPFRGGEVGQALSTFGLVLALFVLGGSLLHSRGGFLGPRAATLVAQLGFVLLPALAAARLSSARPARALGLRPVRPMVGLLGVGMGVCALPPLLLLSWFLTRLPLEFEELEQAMRRMLKAEGPLQLLGVVVLAAVVPGVCEELLFRGWILGRLHRRLSLPAALLIQALLFALLHAHPVRMLPMVLLGLMLGWVRLRAGSVLPTVFAHTAYNALLILLLQQAQPTLEDPPPPGPASWILALGGLILLGIQGMILVRAFPPPGETDPRDRAAGDADAVRRPETEMGETP